MVGLVSYASSDDDEDVGSPVKTSDLAPEVTETVHRQRTKGQESDAESTAIDPTPTTATEVTTSAQSAGDAPILGPSLGPSMPDPDAATYSTLEEPIEEAQDDDVEPQSPYSANRAMLRTLTLPPMQNRDIPPSPPGSPDPSTNKKFAHFLELKKQGIHFNDKLAKSSALKNPSLAEKLMEFAEFEQMDEYATTLSTELWDPTAFPKSVYKDGLAKSQEQVRKQREEERATGQRPIEFVTAAGSTESSRSGTPGSGQGRTMGKSTAERVIAGLDRGRVGSPQVHAGTKRKTRFDS